MRTGQGGKERLQWLRIHPTAAAAHGHTSPPPASLQQHAEFILAREMEDGEPEDQRAAGCGGVRGAAPSARVTCAWCHRAQGCVRRDIRAAGGGLQLEELGRSLRGHVGGQTPRWLLDGAAGMQPAAVQSAFLSPFSSSVAGRVKHLRCQSGTPGFLPHPCLTHCRCTMHAPTFLHCLVLAARCRSRTGLTARGTSQRWGITPNLLEKEQPNALTLVE